MGRRLELETYELPGLSGRMFARNYLNEPNEVRLLELKVRTLYLVHLSCIARIWIRCALLNPANGFFKLLQQDVI